MVDDKYIGLSLAILSTLAIGSSFVITKKGLNHATHKHGFTGEGFAYLRSPLWWGGITTLALGEVANFAAYAFAPPVLVTPLGALSVLIGAVLGSYFLNERLGLIGKIGCALCLIGSVIIVLHAPPDKPVERIDELLALAIRPVFLLYCFIIILFSVVMIYKVAPVYGRSQPLVYLSICSSVGSVSIMAIKAFGIAVKLSLGGHNQFGNPSTYVFGIVVVVCLLTQMNYFNKALSEFPISIVNPIYYVTFTTCTLTASFILFGGFNTTDAISTISLLCGFLVIFSGVYLLDHSRLRRSDGSVPRAENEVVASVGVTGNYSARRSFQDQASGEGGHHRRTFSSSRTPSVPLESMVWSGQSSASNTHRLSTVVSDSDDENPFGDGAKHRLLGDDSAV